MASIADVIDAYATDLATLNLGQTQIWKYLDPPVIPPQFCPLLAVFVRQGDYDVIATNDSYENGEVIVVAWFENALKGTETGGVGDQALATATLTKIETITARLRTYATAIPGFAAQSEADLTTLKVGLLPGGLYAGQIETRVRRWPQT